MGSFRQPNQTFQGFDKCFCIIVYSFNNVNEQYAWKNFLPQKKLNILRFLSKQLSTHLQSNPTLQEMPLLIDMQLVEKLINAITSS